VYVYICIYVYVYVYVYICVDQIEGEENKRDPCSVCV